MFLVKLCKVEAEFDRIAANEFHVGYMKGQWTAFDKVLNIINTFDTVKVPKKDLYNAVMDMRPE